MRSSPGGSGPFARWGMEVWGWPERWERSEERMPKAMEGKAGRLGATAGGGGPTRWHSGTSERPDGLLWGPGTPRQES